MTGFGIVGSRAGQIVLAAFLAKVEETPDITLAESCRRFESGPARCGGSSDRHGIRLQKKNRVHAAEQERPDVAARRWAWFEINPISIPEPALVFIDARLRGLDQNGRVACVPPPFEPLVANVAVPGPTWTLEDNHAFTVFPVYAWMASVSVRADAQDLDGPMNGVAFLAYVDLAGPRRIEDHVPVASVSAGATDAC